MKYFIIGALLYASGFALHAFTDYEFAAVLISLAGFILFMRGAYKILKEAA